MRTLLMAVCLALVTPTLAANADDKAAGVREQVADLLTDKQFVTVEQAIEGWLAAVAGGDETVVQPGFASYLEITVWRNITHTQELESLLYTWANVQVGGGAATSETEAGQ